VDRPTRRGGKRVARGEPFLACQPTPLTNRHCWIARTSAVAPYTAYLAFDRTLRARVCSD
jgi:hypothetical protein